MWSIECISNICIGDSYLSPTVDIWGIAFCLARHQLQNRRPLFHPEYWNGNKLSLTVIVVVIVVETKRERKKNR
jgi:hypothetical protein